MKHQALTNADILLQKDEGNYIICKIPDSRLYAICCWEKQDGYWHINIGDLIGSPIICLQKVQDGKVVAAFLLLMQWVNIKSKYLNTHIIKTINKKL